MKLRPMPRVVVLGSAAVLGTMVASFASCAENVDETPLAEDAASLVPETLSPAVESDAGVPEAGCDASDPACTTEVVPCETVAWCLVPTGVSTADTLTAVWGTSKSDVWAVGSAGRSSTTTATAGRRRRRVY
jgi:hypothetical protein